MIEPGIKLRFELFNTQGGDTIARVEMDSGLLNEDAGIVDSTTMTLRPIKGGGIYTLLPLDDHTIATLKRVAEVYKNITAKPMGLFSTATGRMDDLIMMVGLLFGTIEYIVVENAADMSNIINPPDDGQPKIVKYNIMEDILAKMGVADQDDAKSLQELIGAKSDGD